MRQFDFRDAQATLDSEDRTYVVLATDTTYLFRWDLGNRTPWIETSNYLKSRLPGGFHQGISDVSLGQSDVCIDSRCGDEAVIWISNELVRRGVVQPSMPVVMVHEDGHEQDLGPVGGVVTARSMAHA